LDRVRFFHKGADIIPLLIAVRLFRPDVLLDFNDNPSTTSGLLARWCGAKTLVGFAFEKSRRFLTHPVDCPSKEKTHITERLRKIPEALGIEFEENEIVPSMTIGEREFAEVASHLTEERAGRVVAVNVSAGHPSRYWQADRWVTLLTALTKLEPASQFLLLSDRRDNRLVAEIGKKMGPGKVILPSANSFHHFAAYIAQSNLLISPDTSAVHIASAFHIPVLGLYPAVEWNHTSWHPIGTSYETVRPDEGLVDSIQPEAVLAAYLRLQEQSR